MIKTKKKNIHAPLVITGYVLFALLIIATLASTTIPFGLLLFNPKVMHVNVAVFLVAFTVGTLLPVVLGYIVGDHSIKTKNKLTHHFTAMLFGLLAYWIMTLLSVFMTAPPQFFAANHNIGLIVENVLPSIGVALITTILAVAHMRSRQSNQEIMKYKPFSVLLIVSIVVLPLWSLIQNIFANSVGLFSFVPLIMLAVSGIISYAALHKAKLNTYDKVVWVAVSVSMLFVATFVLSQFLFAISNYLLPASTMEAQSLVSWVGFGLALTVWGAYWFKQVKSLL